VLLASRSAEDSEDVRFRIEYANFGVAQDMEESVQKSIADFCIDDDTAAHLRTALKLCGRFDGFTEVSLVSAEALAALVAFFNSKGTPFDKQNLDAALASAPRLPAGIDQRIFIEAFATACLPRLAELSRTSDIAAAKLSAALTTLFCVSGMRSQFRHLVGFRKPDFVTDGADKAVACWFDGLSELPPDLQTTFISRLTFARDCIARDQLLKHTPMGAFADAVESSAGVPPGFDVAWIGRFLAEIFAEDNLATRRLPVDIAALLADALPLQKNGLKNNSSPPQVVGGSSSQLSASPKDRRSTGDASADAPAAARHASQHTTQAAEQQPVDGDDVCGRSVKLVSASSAPPFDTPASSGPPARFQPRSPRSSSGGVASSGGRAALQPRMEMFTLPSSSCSSVSVADGVATHQPAAPAERASRPSGGRDMPRSSGGASRASASSSCQPGGSWRGMYSTATATTADQPASSLLPRSAACAARSSGGGAFQPSGGAPPQPTHVASNRAVQAARRGSKAGALMALTAGAAALAISQSDRPLEPMPPPFAPCHADDDDVGWLHMASLG
jgi:hypothetical protein